MAKPLVLHFAGPVSASAADKRLRCDYPRAPGSPAVQSTDLFWLQKAMHPSAYQQRTFWVPTCSCCLWELSPEAEACKIVCEAQ